MLFFHFQVLSCLPRDLPWSIPDREFEYRRDLRSQCIFTIDPSTARDLDDAVSCEDLGDGSSHCWMLILSPLFFYQFAFRDVLNGNFILVRFRFIFEKKTSDSVWNEFSSVWKTWFRYCSYFILRNLQHYCGELRELCILYAKLGFILVLKRSSSTQWMQVKLFLSLLIWIADCTQFLLENNRCQIFGWFGSSSDFSHPNLNRISVFCTPCLLYYFVSGCACRQVFTRSAFTLLMCRSSLSATRRWIKLPPVAPPASTSSRKYVTLINFVYILYHVLVYACGSFLGDLNNCVTFCCLYQTVGYKNKYKNNL